MFDIARPIRSAASRLSAPSALQFWWSRLKSTAGIPTGLHATPLVSEDAALSEPTGARPWRDAATAVLPCLPSRLEAPCNVRHRKLRPCPRALRVMSTIDGQCANQPRRCALQR